MIMIIMVASEKVENNIDLFIKFIKLFDAST